MQFEHRCYIFNLLWMTHDEAHGHCQNQGGNLADISSLEENDLIQELLQEQGTPLCHLRVD